VIEPPDPPRHEPQHNRNVDRHAGEGEQQVGAQGQRAAGQVEQLGAPDVRDRCFCEKEIHG